MSRLMTRGIVLTASRFSNYAILFLTPLFLVRIFDVTQYGQYREFMLYAMFIIAVSGFSIDRSLTYFLPKYPDREVEFVSQTMLMVLASSTASVAILLVSGPLFEKITSYDFTWHLAGFVFCFVNLNFLEYYWIAKKRTDLVLIYSSGRLAFRVLVVLVVAVLSRDLTSVLDALVATEAIRLLAVILIVSRSKIVSLNFSQIAFLDQVRYVVPLGFSTIVQRITLDLSRLYVSVFLGPAALAFYAIGGYLTPVVQILRVSISDVVFPELTGKQSDVDGAIRLWRRATVLYAAIMLPMFVPMVFFAKELIGSLFTDAYLSAVPIFQVYALYLVRRCFAFDVLLRREGRTDLVLRGSMIGLIINAVLIVPSYKLLGLVGPAVAIIVTEIATEIYFAFLSVKIFDKKLQSLVDLISIGKVCIACIVCLPLLGVGEVIVAGDLYVVIIASTSYISAVLVLSAILGVRDLRLLARYCFGFLTDRS